MPLTIKAARIIAGYSRKEVAEKLGLSISGYAKKEDGRAKFYIDEAVILSDLFGIDIQIFFEAVCLKKTQVELGK